jgi:hypothetical protein
LGWTRVSRTLRVVITPGSDVPAAFVAALQALSKHRLRAEIRLTEIPAPTRIAPFAVALSAEVGQADEDGLAEPVTGRFVLLHDPDGQDAWQGTFRVVTLTRAPVDPEVAADPVLAAAAWSWVEEALEDAEAAHHALGGTVTVVSSTSFGALEGRPEEVEVEIRASWTPDAGMAEHLQAWGDLVSSAAGLPPLQDGVAAFRR